MKTTRVDFRSGFVGTILLILYTHHKSAKVKLMRCDEWMKEMWSNMTRCLIMTGWKGGSDVP